MDSNNGNSYTPNLRFPGFDEEWVEKNMEELCKPITPSFKLQSRDYLKAGKYPIVDQSQSLICGWTNDDKGLVKNVPVIVFGDHTCVLKYIDFPFIQGADGVKILSPKKDYDSRFVFQSFLANPVKPDGYKRHFSDFKEKTYLVPSPAEQQKIASCLSEMDNLISAQSQKVESLKTHKKGLMQQLFPQQGGTTPQLRFPGLTGDWDEKKLGDIGDTYSGLSGKSKEDFEKGNSKFITFMNVLNNVKIDTDILGTVNITEGERQNKVEFGDMLFNTSSETPEEVGFCAVFVSILEEDVYLNSFCFGYRFHDRSKHLPFFLAYYMRSDCGRELMHRLAQGITRFNLSKGYFNKAIVRFPSSVEQQKIASCLSELDKNIKSESIKLESLKNHKRGLMQQLFPEPIK